MYWLNRLHKRIERAWMDGRHHELHPFKDDTMDIVATAALSLDQVVLIFVFYNYVKVLIYYYIGIYFSYFRCQEVFIMCVRESHLMIRKFGDVYFTIENHVLWLLKKSTHSIWTFLMHVLS